MTNENENMLFSQFGGSELEEYEFKDRKMLGTEELMGLDYETLLVLCCVSDIVALLTPLFLTREISSATGATTEILIATKTTITERRKS